MCSPTDDPTGAPPTATFSVHVLGCKVNQYEAAQIASFLTELGLRPARGGAPPDVAVVHSCAVTAAAARESARWIHRLRAAGARAVIASGCAAAAGEADAAVRAGPGWAAELQRLLARYAPMPAAGAPQLDNPLRRFGGHTRAFLKIQDGCDLGCSYCIVPSLRGPPRDKPLAIIVREARDLVAAGHIEIVLSGVSVGLWGRGSGGRLSDVVRAVCRTEGLGRLRLSSLHPAELSDDLLAAMAEHPAVAPHVHLPLQSGSDRILAAMRRGYDRAAFLAAVAAARRRLDRPSFTTDVIAGFPGETEADFSATLATCQEVGFARLHIFPYSARPDTPAAAMPGAVPAAAVQDRCRRLREAARVWETATREAWVGETVEVLGEQHEDGCISGYSERYLPARFEGSADRLGRLTRLRIESADARGLFGRPVDAGFSAASMPARTAPRP